MHRRATGQKGLFKLVPACVVDVLLNFQQMLDLEFPETSQNLSLCSQWMSYLKFALIAVHCVERVYFDPGGSRTF